MKPIVIRLAAVAAVAALALTMMPLVAFAAFENTHKNTGDQAWDIVAIAETQVGYKEGTLAGTTLYYDNYTKYGVWYENNVQSGGYTHGAWCAMFVTWCAKEAGIPNDIVYYHAYCPFGVNWFQERGLFHKSLDSGGAAYTPKRGDIVYFKESRGGASHVGLVRYTDGDTVYTVEGNANSMDNELIESGGVYLRHYDLTSHRLLGFASPKYADGYSTTASSLGTYRMTGDQVNLRTGPSTSYSAIAQLKKGEIITVSERTDDGWGKLKRTNGTVGWSKISSYASYIGQDMLAGNITASRDHVRITTDSTGRVTLDNPGAAAVTIDLPVTVPVGTATTPYFNLSSTALSGGYSLSFTDANNSYTMHYNPTATKLQTTQAAAITKNHTAKIAIKPDWKPKSKCKIAMARVTLNPTSKVRLNYAYFAVDPNTVTSTSFNTRVYDRSDLTAVAAANVNLMSPHTLRVDTVDVNGGYTYNNGRLTVTTDNADGYAVTMTPNVTYTPEVLHRLLCEVSSDVAYDVTCTITTAGGDRTLSLATDYRNSVGAQNRWIPAGTNTLSVSLYAAYRDEYALPNNGQSTIKAITVRLREAGTLTLSALQLNNQSTVISFADGIQKSEQTVEAPKRTVGDVNNDNAINMRDAFALYHHAGGGEPLSADDAAFADINGDGVINMRDALALYLRANGG